MFDDPGFLKRMPKADLHVHIDGSVRTKTIIELARERNYALPSFDEEELERHVSVSRAGSLHAFLRTFEVFYPLLKDPAAVERISRELVIDEAADGVVYLEARFAPVLQASRATPVREIVKAALKGLKAGMLETGIRAGLIVCCYRSESENTSMQTVDAAIEYMDRGVVGVDLAGDETNYPALLHLDAFIKARKAGLPVTMHAGEAGPTSDIQEALFLFGARRIGHAVNLPGDAQLMKFAAAEKIGIEVCLTSNLVTGAVDSIASHPLKTFLENGIRAFPNTDDPAVCRTSLSAEYALAAREFGLERGDIMTMCASAFESAFTGEEEKKSFIRDLEGFFDGNQR